MFNSTNFIAPYLTSDKRLILRDSNLHKVGGVNVCHFQKVSTEGVLVWINLSDLKIVLEFASVADAKQAVLNLKIAIEALHVNCPLGGSGAVIHDGSLTGAGTLISPLSVVGGGESLLTYAQAQTAMSAGTLIPGAYYKITDRLDAGMIFLATTAKQFDTNGVGGFFNADWQAVGTMSGSIVGQWHTSMPVPAIGKIAIYNDSVNGSRHYRNLTGVVGTAPSIDAVNWVLLPKSVANGYIEEWDFIIYDFNNDYLNNRKDTRGNDISDTAFVGNGGISIFQWGNDNVTSNYADSASTLTCQNNHGAIFENTLIDGATINASGNSGQIGLCSLSGGSYLGATNNTGQLYFNTLSGSSQLSVNTNAGIVSECRFLAGINVHANLNSGINIQSCSFTKINNSVITLDPAVTVSGGRLEPGFSNFQANLDFTIPPISGKTLNIPASLNYVGIFNILNSAPSNTIDSFTNWPIHGGIVSFILDRTSRIVFDHNNTIGSWVAGQAVCPFSEPHYVFLRGHTDGSDRISYILETDVFVRQSYQQLSLNSFVTDDNLIHCNGGVANTYTALNSNAVLVRGHQYRVFIDVTSTGASTLQVGKNPAMPIAKEYNYGPIANGSLQGGRAYVFTYDGVSFVKVGTVYVNNSISGASDQLSFNSKYQTIAGALAALEAGENGLVVVESSPLAYTESIIPLHNTKITFQSGTIIAPPGHFIDYSSGAGVTFDVEGFAAINTPPTFDVVHISSGSGSQINLSCQSIYAGGNLLFSNRIATTVEIRCLDNIQGNSGSGLITVSGAASRYVITTLGDINDTQGGGIIDTAAAGDSELIINASRYNSFGGGNAGFGTPQGLLKFGGYVEMNCDIYCSNTFDVNNPAIAAAGSGAVELVINGSIKELGSNKFMELHNGTVTFNGPVATQSIMSLTSSASQAVAIFNQKVNSVGITASLNSKLFCNADWLADTTSGSAPAAINMLDTSTLVATGIYIVQLGVGLNTYVLQVVGTTNTSLNNVKLVNSNPATDAVTTGFSPLVLNSFGPLFGNCPLNTPGFITLNYGQAYIQDLSVTNPYA